MVFQCDSPAEIDQALDDILHLSDMDRALDDILRLL